MPRTFRARDTMWALRRAAQLGKTDTAQVERLKLGKADRLKPVVADAVEAPRRERVGAYS